MVLPTALLIGAGIFIGLALVVAYILQLRTIEVDPARRKESLSELKNAGDTAWDQRSTPQKIYECYCAIYEGAHTFLHAEYLVFSIYAIFFTAIIVVIRGSLTTWADGIFAGVGFILGSGTSLAAGYVGMKIAVYSNARTAIKAQESLAAAFDTAFRGGAVMGFTIVTLGIASLAITILLFQIYFLSSGYSPLPGGSGVESLFKAIAGFGVGAASVAMFSRVGGGIYTKAADVGADLVGKIEAGIPEDDARNPATIADNVGDNVGDIAGMGADLFSSMTGSCIAAFILTSEVGTFNGTVVGTALNYTALAFPIALHASGIICCAVASMAHYFIRVNNVGMIKRALQVQELLSTFLAAAASVGVTYMCLPADGFAFRGKQIFPWHVVVCLQLGIWAGLAVGFITEYYTAYAYKPVQEVATSCKTGAATNIISGLALGYNSALVPIIILAALVWATQELAGIYGIAIATIGILSCLSTSLSIDAYGPICDNAGGIAEMSDMGDEIRHRTDALDAAGNTTAAIGKGFAITSACLVSIALIGAFTRSVSDWRGQEGRVTGILWNNGWNNGVPQWNQNVRVIGTEPRQFHEWAAILPGMGTEARLMDPLIFAGLLIGAVLPYIFTAMTMKSVGKAAMAMVEEVRSQFANNAGILAGTVKPDYARCIEISTKASLREMILPGTLVIFTPIVAGFLFGTRFLTGVLVGAVLAGIQFAIAQSNTGGAWDNAKKYIKAGHLNDYFGEDKRDEAYNAAVTGDTVGDPLKDTSGPAINVLLKNMCLIAVLFVEAMVAAEKTKTYYNPAGLIGLGFKQDAPVRTDPVLPIVEIQ